MIVVFCVLCGYFSVWVEVKLWVSIECFGVFFFWGIRCRGRDRIKKGFYFFYGEFGGGKILKN